MVTGVGVQTSAPDIDPCSVGSTVERLADHAFRDKVWEKAFLYCRQAGKAVVRSAYREVVTYDEQAL